MSQFVPSKKTINDFNSGERYLNKIDVVQAPTINNLVEGLLYAQENGSSGDKFVTLDTEQEITAEKLFSHGIEVHGHYSEYYDRGGILLNDAGNDVPDTRITNSGLIRNWADWEKPIEINFPLESGTFALLSDIPSLDNYVTLNTEQTISGGKTFSGHVRFTDNFVGFTGVSVGKILGEPSVEISDESNSFGTYYRNNKILYEYAEDTFAELAFPSKSGELALKSDISDIDLSKYVTLDTPQSITAVKSFVTDVFIEGQSNSATPNIVFTSERSGNSVLFNGSTFITKDNYGGTGNTTSTISLPSKSGTLLVDTDLADYVKKTGDTMSGNLNFTRGSINMEGELTLSQYGLTMISQDSSYGKTQSSYVGVEKIEIGDDDNSVASSIRRGGFYHKNGEETISVSSNIIEASDNLTIKSGGELSLEANTLSFGTTGGWEISGSNGEEGQVLTSNGDTSNPSWKTQNAKDILYFANSPSGSGQVQTSVKSALDELYRLPSLIEESLEKYVTLDTYQTISGAKTFGQAITCTAKSTSADTTAEYYGDKITYFRDGGEYNLSFPSKSGTFALLSDIPNLDNYATRDYVGNNFVRLVGDQTVEGQKTFSETLTVSNGDLIVGQFTDGKTRTQVGNKTIQIGAGPNNTSITISPTTLQFIKYTTYSQVRNTLFFPEVDGTIALTSDIPSISISNIGSGNVVTGIYASGHTITVTKGNVSGGGVTYDDIYRVGSIYISTSSTSPSSLFGGSWTEIGRDTFLMAAGSGYTSGRSGGSNSITLSIDQIPEHTHYGLLGRLQAGSSTVALMGYSDEEYRQGMTSVGGGQPFDNRPAYYTVHIWRRTA